MLSSKEGGLENRYKKGRVNFSIVGKFITTMVIVIAVLILFISTVMGMQIYKMNVAKFDNVIAQEFSIINRTIDIFCNPTKR